MHSKTAVYYVNEIRR